MEGSWRIDKPWHEAEATRHAAEILDIADAFESVERSERLVDGRLRAAQARVSIYMSTHISIHICMRTQISMVPIYAHTRNASSYTSTYTLKPHADTIEAVERRVCRQ